MDPQSIHPRIDGLRIQLSRQSNSALTPAAGTLDQGTKPCPSGWPSLVPVVCCEHRHNYSGKYPEVPDSGGVMCMRTQVILGVNFPSCYA